MKKKHSEHTETADRKMQIIQAALECFADAGYVDTTMEAIRARSGASNGSIYHHFKSKEQLAGAVYIEGIKDYQAGLSEALPGMAAREGIAKIVRHHLDWVGGNRLWAQFLFTMRHADFMRDTEGAISRQNAQFVEMFSGWFKKQAEAGRIRSLSRAIYMSIIWGPCQEYARLWLDGKRDIAELDAAAVEIGEAAWRALKANAAPDAADEKPEIPELILKG